MTPMARACKSGGQGNCRKPRECSSFWRSNGRARSASSFVRACGIESSACFARCWTSSSTAVSCAAVSAGRRAWISFSQSAAMHDKVQIKNPGMIRPRCLVLVIFLLLALCLPVRSADLFHDDFSQFPPGWLTNPVGTLNAAIQEYHYLPNRGVPLGNWENAICHLDAWVVGDEDGKSYLEQQLPPDSNQFQKAIFLTGDEEWSDYTVEALAKPLALGNLAGIVFRYQTNRHYYLFALDGGKARLALHRPLEKEFRVPDFRELGSAAFP